ncbi:hypothetical protein CKJ90_28750, partial [Klebsiella pneumoniae]
SKSEVDIVIHHDRKSESDYGQQTAKAILDSDYFVKNNQGQRAHLKAKVKRFYWLDTWAKWFNSNHV